ncbi:MAG: NAD(P)H-dependent oxidoreductase [Pseudomonadota bacterium]
MAHAKLLFFSGSTREASLNRKLAALAQKVAQSNGINATLLDLNDYPLPIYNGDLEEKEGVPDNARALKAIFEDHQGIFIASPEYNGGVSPLLKNTIDWITRINDEDMKGGMVFKTRAFAIGSVAASEMGGVRGLIQLRQILAVALGGLVLGGGVQVPGGPDKFDDDGMLVEEPRFNVLKDSVKRLGETATALFVETT